jgi:hypothetical protein
MLVLVLPVNAATRNEVLWRDPGRVERLDFIGGPGGRAGAPRPPFRFIKEDTSGTSAKVFVRDARGRTWNVKFGPEVKGEVFAARVAWATGYYAQPVHFVPSGRILAVRDLSRRASAHIASDGRFTGARFQFRDSRLKFMDENDWSWSYNPFFGTRELAGLKIIIMLTSNWDNKDARDIDRGSNTAIFERRGQRPRYLYAFTDWGQTMGRWGSPGLRSSWSCGGYSSDTPDFVRGVDDGRVKFGYSGQHTNQFAGDIRTSDVQWLMRYLGRVRDSQIRAGLLASGATRQEADCFTSELRKRLNMLRSVVPERRTARATTSRRTN